MLLHEQHFEVVAGYRLLLKFGNDRLEVRQRANGRERWNIGRAHEAAELAFTHAVAVAFDDRDIGVMQQPVQQVDDASGVSTSTFRFCAKWAEKLSYTALPSASCGIRLKPRSADGTVRTSDRGSTALLGVLIFGTLPKICYAEGITSFLYERKIRIFDYPKYHWSVDQCEYAIDIVFKRQADLAAIYGNLTWTAIDTVKPDNIAT